MLRLRGFDGALMMTLIIMVFPERQEVIVLCDVFTGFQSQVNLSIHLNCVFLTSR